MKLSRRRFVKLLGAGSTAVAAGFMGCGGDDKKTPAADVADILGEDGVEPTDIVDGKEVDAGGPGVDADATIDPTDTKETVDPIDTNEMVEKDDGGSGCADMPDYVDTREVKVGVETTTICPYCGCGCGLLVTAVDGKVTNTEGDPDHPINEGALCSKGQALYQVANNERRLDKVLHRAPGATEWTEVTWDVALDAIAAKVKETRDAEFIEEDDDGKTVNRVEAMGLMGSAALDNEECYALSKLARALGLVYIEHQARI